MDETVKHTTEAGAGSDRAPQIKGDARGPAAQIVDVLGSSLLTAVVLALLMVLTYVGTVFLRAFFLPA